MTKAAARWVAVGKVGRPHGVGGAFVVEDASEDAERFAAGARVFAGREPATVVERKRSGGRLVVRLDRVVPRGVSLEVPVSALPPTADGEFYAFELEGLDVVDDSGRDVGRVRRVEPGIANDVLELESGLALPLVEDCVLSVDLADGRIVIARAFAESE